MRPAPDETVVTAAGEKNEIPLPSISACSRMLLRWESTAAIRSWTDVRLAKSAATSDRSVSTSRAALNISSCRSSCSRRDKRDSRVSGFDVSDILPSVLDEVLGLSLLEVIRHPGAAPELM